MGLYSRCIFPRLLDWTMSRREVEEQRARLLAGVSGEVLEIGFGTGLNLPFYPDAVTRLTALDVNPGMAGRAAPRLRDFRIPFQTHVLDSQELPMDSGQFDCVVSTWVLCSIPDVEKALTEIRRVLKPGGRFFFVEHGLSPEPKVSAWQNRLNPIQKILADGCQLNRNIRQLVERRRLRLLEIENEYLRKSPKFLGYLYRGIAQK